MSAQPSNLFDTLAAALSAAPVVNLANLPTAAPIETAEDRWAKRMEWLNRRHGKFTASAFHRLMTNPRSGDGLSKGAETYCREVAVERMTECRPDGYVSAAMQWGLDHELEAITAFEAHTGLKTEKTGDNQEFIDFGPDIGGTPDGIVVGTRLGVEIKCPNSATHAEYLGIGDAESLLEIAPDYYWQVQGLMMILDSAAWWFVSYDPRFRAERLRLHVALIERDEVALVRLRQKLSLAIECRDEYLERIGSIP